MNNILILDKISPIINEILEGYNISNDLKNPKSIILRSFKMHDYPINDDLLAVARAGAGVNNIPIPEMSKRGIVVFNTPGANANAVKELALCSLLLASRDIFEGITWSNTLNGDVEKQVEKGKGNFAGCELKDKTLGVIGLGAIGLLIANAAVSLGMTVYGYDPYVSEENKAKLNECVKIVYSLKHIYEDSDYISLHTPLLDSTKNMICAESISQLKKGVKIINMSRGGLVNSDDVIQGIKDGIIKKYVTDFPSEKELNQPGVIPIPHLGASTEEAEDNCAIMAANQLKDFLENGNIVNSVNFPKIKVPEKGNQRLLVLAENYDELYNDLSLLFEKAKITIASNKNYKAVIIDADVIEEKKKELIDNYDCVIKTRLIK